MRYNAGTEHSQPTCLPPEAYIQIMRNIKNEGQPKFLSSVYPTKIKPKDIAKTSKK